MSQHKSLQGSSGLVVKRNVLKRFEESHDFGDIIDDRYTVSDKIELLLGHFAPGSG